MYQVFVERYILMIHSTKYNGIIDFYGIFQDEDSFYFILKYCPFGDLDKFIKNFNLIQIDK